MRITIQVTCESPEDAQDAIARLTRKHPTWDEMGDVKPAAGALTSVHTATSARVDKIMEAPARKNVSPGEPSIGKIGKETAKTLLDLIGNNQQPAPKWAEHCKLLWKRGEVLYDGEGYYL